MHAKLFGCMMLSLSVAAPALAQTTPTSPVDPARLAAARKLFDLLQAGDRAQKVVEQVFGAASDAMLKQQLSKTNSNDPNFAERQRRLMLVRKDENTALMSDIMPQMIAETTLVYAKEFTVDELNAATTYYSSSAGQAFLHKQPVVLREVMQTVIPKLMPAFQKRSAEMKTKMEAAVADLPPPPGN